MRTVEFTPELCKPTVEKLKDGSEKQVEPEFSGSVKLRVPNVLEKQEILINSGFSQVKDLAEISRLPERAQAKLMIKLIRETMKFIMRVDLTHNPTKTRVTSVDDFLHAQEFAVLYSELAFKVISLGKSQEN